MTIYELLKILDPVIYVLGLFTLITLSASAFLCAVWLILKRTWRILVGAGAISFIAFIILLLSGFLHS